MDNYLTSKRLRTTFESGFTSNKTANSITFKMCSFVSQNVKVNKKLLIVSVDLDHHHLSPIFLIFVTVLKRQRFERLTFIDEMVKPT